MTDIAFAPTLRDLIIERKYEGIGWNDTACTVIGEACLNENDIERVEADLLAPLRKEITTLRTQVEKGSAIINRLGNTIERNDSDRAMLNVRIRILHNQVTIRDGEIARLRTKVAAADIFLGSVYAALGRKSTTSDAFESIANAATAYDATKTEGTAEAVGQDDAPPAVADAGEMGEDRERSIYRTIAHNAEHAAMWYQNMNEQLAALRRDVEAVSLEVRDATCAIVDTRDNMMYELKERIERLESHERPKPDTIEVTEKMVRAYSRAALMYDRESMDNQLYKAIERGLVAALAAKDGGT